MGLVDGFAGLIKESEQIILDNKYICIHTKKLFDDDILHSILFHLYSISSNL